jgi:hypothetical protein
MASRNAKKKTQPKKAKKKSTPKRSVEKQKPEPAKAAEFIDWCKDYAKVEDKNSHQNIAFELYPCQKAVAELLIQRNWLWILKARRLGLTWLLAAYAAWLITQNQNRTIVVLNQNKEYACDFLDRVRLILDNLPPDQQMKRTTDSKTALRIQDTGGSLRSLACTRTAIRSLAADLVIFDEAAYMDLLKKARAAAQPAVEIGGGQVVGISTSNGPGGEFYDVWMKSKAGNSRYQPVFLDWRQLRGRDDKWYAKEQRENSGDPLYMKREYPATPEEAFESAEGRVYPSFVHSPAFVKDIAILPNWPKYRAIDFGGVDPFVCLWGVVIPKEPPGLTVSPACENLIRELLAYSNDKSGSPADENNHACDALRYMVITPGAEGINGHLHIYRELYVPDSARAGLSLADLTGKIKSIESDLARVLPLAAEKNSTSRVLAADFPRYTQYELTIADRSRPDSINFLCQQNIPAVAQRHLGGSNRDEVIQGTIRVNNLIVGTKKGPDATPIQTQTYARIPQDLHRKGIY